MGIFSHKLCCFWSLFKAIQFLKMIVLVSASVSNKAFIGIGDISICIGYDDHIGIGID